MKTEQEIIEKLNTYKEIKNNAFVFTREFTLASGAITALEWVLSKSERGDGNAE